MKHSEALKNSFGAIKKDIEGIKARNFLIDTKLKNSFANIKKDMDYLKESIAEVKDKREDFVSPEQLNERLGKIDAAVKDGFSEDIKRLEKDVYKDFERDFDKLRSELKSLDKARMKNGDSFEKAIDSLRDELDVDSKLKKIEKRISKPVVREVIVEKPVIKEIPVVKKIAKEKSVKKEKSVFDEEKPKKKGKGVFTKMIDFFAEE